MNRHSLTRQAGKIALSALGVLIALVWAFPVYWMLVSAVTPNARLRAVTPTFFPDHFTTRSFARLLGSGSSFWPALRMSLTVTSVAVVVVLVCAFFGALAVSRFQFRGRKGFILSVLFIQMLPAEGLFIAQYRLLANAGMLNRVGGIAILYAAAIIPFTVWMLRGFVAGVPAELEEAAMVDGLTRTQAFRRVTLPLLAPGLVASGVYAFLQAWNEFTIALVALPANSSNTLPLWLRGFMTASVARGVDWAQVMAASTLITVPVIILFLVVHHHMTAGVVSGAVKG
ncbi:MAG: carbohydrate ABC transporter permease [Cellulomonadaceae bacterium]|jgi:N,N'-diacetylchitobiose transport system permease protein|nr:carbohydrate ABC transporter permease [Cellulomonadaceae bacterium]